MYGLYGLKHHTVEISGGVTRRDGRTREDNATQPLDAGRLSFAICKFESQGARCAENTSYCTILSWALSSQGIDLRPEEN